MRRIELGYVPYEYIQQCIMNKPFRVESINNGFIPIISVYSQHFAIITSETYERANGYLFYNPHKYYLVSQVEPSAIVHTREEAVGICQGYKDNFLSPSYNDFIDDNIEKLNI